MLRGDAVLSAMSEVPNGRERLQFQGDRGKVAETVGGHRGFRFEKRRVIIFNKFDDLSGTAIRDFLH